MFYNPQEQPIMYHNGGMYMPPNPIGNIAPIGYGGYNGSYYTGNYASYNPYYIQQQKEIQIAQQRESQRIQNSILKKLYRSSAKCLHYEIDEETLSQFDEPEDITDGLTWEEKLKYDKLLKEEQRLSEHQQIISIQQNMVPSMSMAGYMYSNAYSDMSQKAKEEVPDDVGLVEYLENYAPKKYIETMDYNQKQAQYDLTQIYNKEDYNKLVTSRKTSLFGNSVFNPEATIDDQEIKLPNFISERTRQERRKMFIDSIMRGG
jgi:hypothetical protein